MNIKMKNRFYGTVMGKFTHLRYFIPSTRPSLRYRNVLFLFVFYVKNKKNLLYRQYQTFIRSPTALISIYEHLMSTVRYGDYGILLETRLKISIRVINRSLSGHTSVSASCNFRRLYSVLPRTQIPRRYTILCQHVRLHLRQQKPLQTHRTVNVLLSR